MNSSSIMKRTLPLIIALILIIGIALTLTLTSKKKTAPKISNPDEAFLTYEDLVIKNKDAYNILKVRYGYSTTLDLIDRHLLKNANGKNYIDAITEEQLKKAFKDKYGLDLDEAEEDKLEELFDEIYFDTGLKGQAEVFEMLKLELAKKEYTKDMIRKDQEEHDADEDREENYFPESDYKTQLKNNYKEDIAAIVVPYTTQNEVEIALRQLGIKQSQDKKKWVKVVEGDPDAYGDPLTIEEIKKAFIDLYNSAYAYKVPTYPTNQLVLQEGVHYNIVDGKIVFNHNNFDHDSKLVYTQKQIDKLGLATLLYDDLVGVQDAEDLENAKFYTYQFDRMYSGKYYLVLKIANAAKNELDTVLENGLTIREEITNKFIDNKTTNDRINKEMAKLRKANNLVIYDPFISLNYSLQVSDYKQTKKTHKTIVAKVDGLEITADMLYEELVKLYGVSYFSDRILYYYVLHLTEYNDFFDPKTDKLLTKEARTKYNDEFAEIKTRIKQEYAQYASYITMEEFLISSYNVQTIDELKYLLFYRDILADFRKGFADVEKNWDKYEELMNKKYEEFFEVRGIHLLIHIQDDEGNIVDPEEWTEYQINLAKELTQLIKQTLKKEVTGSKTYATIMSRIQDDFNRSPRLVAGYDVDSPQARPLDDPDALYPEVDYRYSKFKSAGFVLKYEDLGTITPGQMVKPFEEAVRYMWKLNDEEGHHGDGKARMYDNPDKPYIQTEFGFHIFVATNTVDYKYADKENKKLPTKEQVLIYIKATEGVKGISKEEEKQIQEQYKALSEDVKNAIATYFMPIYNEFKGTTSDSGQMPANYADMFLIEAIKNIVESTNTTFANEEYRASLVYYLNKKYESSQRSLTYKLESDN